MSTADRRSGFVRGAAAAVLAATVLLPGSPGVAAAKGQTKPAAEVVRSWNERAFTTVRETRSSDAAAARLYAMVNVAMFDAVNALTDEPRSPAVVPPDGSAGGDAVAAASTAAHDVLVALYPDRAPTYDGQLAKDLAGVTSPGPRRQGASWGSHVADGVLADRTMDGSTPAETYVGTADVGEYRGSWTGVQFRNLEPFAIADPSTYVGSGYPALDSTAYAAAFDEVKVAGDGRVPDDGALGTFRYWSLGTGTNQPPGAWLQVASNVTRARGLGLQDTARLFALESMALADTVAPTYATKRLFHSWRPLTAIREADTDGNDATAPDVGWIARGGNAASPEYWSGHSAFSAAGASVLGAFFCTDDVAFTLATDSGEGGTRSYTRPSDAAAEAGRSRVVGGLHFEFSNQAGLAAGRAIATEVLRTSLLRAGGRGQADCVR